MLNRFKSVYKFFSNLKLIVIMVSSAILAGLYRRKFKPETICYCVSQGEERLMDFYRPQCGSTERLPVIVWFHGGAWKVGNRKAIERIVLEQVEQGFAVVSVSYSLSDIATWPVQCHEAKAAIRYLKANGDSLGVNTDKIIAAGMSAGGHLACMLGVSAGHEQLNGELGDFPGQPNDVAGVLAFYAPTDFLSVSKNFDGLIDYYAEDSPVTQLLGETILDSPQKSDLASPLKLAHSGSPPTFLLHGDADPVVPVEQSIILHDEMLSLGVKSQLMLLQGYTHGDPRFNGGEPAQKVTAFLRNL